MGRPKRQPARTPEARESELVSLALDLAEKKLADGSAPAPVIVHFLKLGCSMIELEREKLEAENSLAKAKAENLQSTKVLEEKYEAAMKAMSSYSGSLGVDDELY